MINRLMAFRLARRSFLDRTVERFLMLRALGLGAIILLGLSHAPAQTQDEARRQLLQHVEAGRLQEAVLLGEKAISQWPGDADIRHWLGLAYFKSGALLPAREQLERARDLNPKDAAIYFDLALVCLSQPDYAAAANALETSVKIAPSNPLAHVLLGRSYLNSNRSVQAIDEFKTALRIDPAFRLGHYHLGFAYSSLGRNDEAIAEYRTELQRSGEHPEVVGPVVQRVAKGARGDQKEGDDEKPLPHEPPRSDSR